MIANSYAAAEVVILGNAHEVVRGSIKGLTFDDGPAMPRREIDVGETE